MMLINSKQPKGDYLQINSQDIVPLKSDIVTQGGTFNGATSTEMSYLEGVHTYVQDQLDGKQPTGNYALKTDLTQYLPLSGGNTTGPLTIQNNTPLVMDSRHNMNLTYDLTISGNHTIAGATPTELSYLHNAKSNLQAQLDTLNSEESALQNEVDGLGTSLVGVEGEIAAIQTQLVSLGVATIANGVFSFANAAGTLISSTVLSSRLSNYLPLTGGTLTGALGGTSGSFTSLAVGGNSVITTAQFNPVLTSVNTIQATYLPLTGGALTGNLSCKQLTCTSEVDTGSLTCTSLSVNGKTIVGDYLPLSGGTLTGNLSCQQLTCTSEVDTGSLTCKYFSQCEW